MRQRMAIASTCYLILCLVLAGGLAYAMEPPIYCTDSDGGIEYFSKGTATIGGESTTDVCLECAGTQCSSCTDNCPALREYYCEDANTLRSVSVTCENGCQDGACVVSTTSCSGLTGMDTCLDNTKCYWDQETNKCYDYKQRCTEPDNGDKIYVQAHTFGFRTYSSASDPSRDLRIRTGGLDACLSDTQLVENYCVDGYNIETEYTDCPNGCKDGACLAAECTSDADCPQIECFAAPCPQNKCVNGECVPTTQPTICKDTDSGKDYYVRGICSSPSITVSAAGPFYDKCFSNQKTLVEYYCGGTNNQYCTSVEVNCTNGCLEGSCVQTKRCAWCGSSCVEYSPNMVCVAVSPPVGFKCEIVDGKCTEVPVAECSGENKTCGGIAGILCCAGLTCKLDGDYPDAGGRCVKVGLVCDNDNRAEGSEACDGTDLRGKTCKDVGSFTGGVLRCSNCRFVTADCIGNASKCILADKVELSELKIVLIKVIKDYFANLDKAKLKVAEIKDLLVAYLSTKGNVADLSVVGRYSGERLRDIYIKVTGIRCPTTGETSCASDGDCACGVHVSTGNCFYGNKKYVNTLKQCPDFCSGIAGNLVLKCVENTCRQVPSTVQTCTDSDGGKNYYVKGYTKGYKDGVIASEVDGCYSDNRTLVEFYCEGSSVIGERFSCPSGCRDGACLATACNNNNVAGGSEVCDGNDLRAKTCRDFDGFTSGVLRCSSCNFDTTDCVVSATTCTDSDNGKNFYVKGTVLDSNKVAQVDECYVLDANGGAVVKDSCGGTNCYVSEHYCETPNSIYGSVSSYRCPYGCMGGVCVCDHDNRVDPGEACDGADLKGKTCLDFDSYNSGVLKCSESCDFDTSQCVGSEGI